MTWKLPTILTATLTICILATFIVKNYPLDSKPKLLTKENSEDQIPIEIQKMYISWSMEYGMIGLKPDEMKRRMFNFYQNYQNLKESPVQRGYEVGMGKFADLTDEEFVRANSGIENMNEETPASDFVEFEPITEQNIDWRAHLEREPSEQGKCKASWAIIAAEALSYAHSIKTGQKVDFSAQQIIDCTKNDRTGCKGSTVQKAVEFILHNRKLSTERDYSFTGVSKKCLANPKPSDIDLSSVRLRFVRPFSQEHLLRALAKQPVISFVNVLCLKNYMSGVVDAKECSGYGLNHAVLIVGAGEESGKKFWVVRNTWGDDWGEEGYFRILRSEEEGLAGINLVPIFLSF